MACPPASESRSPYFSKQPRLYLCSRILPGRPCVVNHNAPPPCSLHSCTIHQDTLLWNGAGPVWPPGAPHGSQAAILDETDFHFRFTLVILKPKELHEAGIWTAQDDTGLHRLPCTMAWAFLALVRDFLNLRIPSAESFSSSFSGKERGWEEAPVANAGAGTSLSSPTANSCNEEHTSVGAPRCSSPLGHLGGGRHPN